MKHQKNVRVEGLEPPSLAAPDPKSGVSTNFTTPAIRENFCLQIRRRKDTLLQD